MFTMVFLFILLRFSLSLTPSILLLPLYLMTLKRGSVHGMQEMLMMKQGSPPQPCHSKGKTSCDLVS